MGSVHERLYAAVVAAILGAEPPTGVVAVHDRRRMASFIDAELPAIRVLPGLDQTVDRIAEYENVNDLTISVQLYVVGEEQAAALPEMHAEIHRRVWAVPTLGGLAIRPFNVDIDERRDESDRLRILKTYRYRWRYRVAADDASLIP